MLPPATLPSPGITSLPAEEGHMRPHERLRACLDRSVLDRGVVAGLVPPTPSIRAQSAECKLSGWPGQARPRQSQRHFNMNRIHAGAGITGRPLTGRAVLVSLLAFFGVVIGVNGVM